MKMETTKYTIKEIGNICWGPKEQRGDIFSRYYYYQLTAPIVYVLQRTKITGNQITLLALLPILASVYLISTGVYPELWWGAFLIQVSHLLDYVDGGLAKTKHMQSDFGKWADGFVDHIKIVGWYLAFAFAYQAQSHNSNAFLIFAFLLGIKIVTDYVGREFVACFEEDHEPLNDDMKDSLIKKIPLLKRIPEGIIKGPIGGGMFPVLLTIGILTNQLLAPFYFYAALHILNTIKTIIYIFIKYRKR